MILQNIVRGLSFIALITCFGFTSFSQSKSFSDRFFIAFHTTTYLDYKTSPLEMVKHKVGTNPDGSSRYAEVPSQSAVVNVFSFGVEPRYNLIELNSEAALAISAPLGFGFGQSYATNENVLGVRGFGSFQLPLLMKLYIGTGSTYDSEKDFGISIGGGIEYNSIGLVNTEGQPITKLDRDWLMPVASLGVHFWRGSAPMEINLKYGATPYVKYYVDLNGDPLLTGTTSNITNGQARAFSFKLTFVSLINY